MTNKDSGAKSGKRGYLLTLIVLVATVCIVFMPREYYPGDAYAVKLFAIHTVQTGALGVAEDEIESPCALAPFAQRGDQFLYHNRNRGRIYPRWGLPSVLLFMIPEIFLDSDWRQQISSSSILAHNILNALLTVVLAIFLFQLALLFSSRPLLGFVFAVTNLFASYVWYYARAQSYDILQLVFFTAFLYFFVLAMRTACTRGPAHRQAIFFYNVLLILLVLTKSIYFMIYPLAWLTVLRESSGHNRLLIRVKRSWPLVLSAGVALVVHAMLNYYRFASMFPPLEIMGEERSLFGLSYVPERLKDYLLYFSANIFAHHPVLLVAVAGVHPFVKKHKAISIFVGATFFLYLLAYSLHINYGEWCYGPRYLLFVLPALSLPAVLFVDDWLRTHRGARRWTLISLLSLLLMGSTVMQSDINRRGFHFSYRLADLFGQYIEDEKVRDYFYYRHKALIARDFDLFVSGKGAFYPFERYLQTGPDEEDKGAMLYYITRIAAPNYFWMDASGGPASLFSARFRPGFL